jgi:hypothetical protein
MFDFERIINKISLSVDMIKGLVFVLFISLVFGRSYPLFKQCDNAWRNEQLGFGSGTICSDGCLVSSVAMALNGLGHGNNPSTLNQWLKGHGGYVNGDWLVWASVNPLGITFQGKVSNSAIKSRIDQGYVVILNVHNGGHYVLATSYNGDTINVNDPGSGNGPYTISQCVDGQTGVYAPHSSTYHNLVGQIKSFLRVEEDSLFIMADRPRVNFSQV